MSDLHERIIVPDRDEPIPSNGQSNAGKWLSEKLNGSGDALMLVSYNGPTALFWFVASLLDEYKNDGPVAESADAVGLNPAVETHEGSTPSEPTKTPFQQWKEDIEIESEQVVEVGQKREFFVDGVGDLEGVITKFDDENCWFKSDIEWCLGWQMPGMNFIGYIVGGEWQAKFQREVEDQAMAASKIDP